MLELEEVRELLDGRRGVEPVEKAAIEIAIQAMLAHQIVYPDTGLLRRETYDLIRRHNLFFEKYFAAMGARLVIESATGMIALVRGMNRYGWQFSRLKKDETLVMLALRLIIDEGVRAGQMDDSGRVESNTDEIIDRVRTLAKADPPAETRLVEILKWLRRRGAVILHEHDRTERLTPLTVLPGIRILVDDAFASSVVTWVEQGTPGDDIFAWSSQQTAEGATGSSGEADAQDEVDEPLMPAGMN